MTGVLTERHPESLAAWMPTSGPRTLAALRVAAGAAALWFAYRNYGFVVPPEHLRSPPVGTAWLDFLPVSHGLYHAAIASVVLGGVLLIAGWRPAAWLTLAAVFYAGWMTTLTGKVDHGHHIMWVLLVLAVSPSANEWTIRREQKAGSYRWPVMAVIIIIGLTYFGAGLQKLFADGFAWGWSDNLTNMALARSWRTGQALPGWLLDLPITGRLLGIAGLLFELGFLPLLLWPQTRRWVWPAGLIFHWGTWLILGIPFLTLQMLYVVFLPWDRADPDSPPSGTQRRVLSGLVAAVTVFTLSGVNDAWPVAAYPSFAGIRSSHAVVFYLETPTGMMPL